MPGSGFYKYLTLEDLEHIKVVDYLNKFHPDVIYTHVPSAGKKSAFERYKYSLLGVKKGIMDFIILHPKHSSSKMDTLGLIYKELIYVGLVIELKVPEHKRMVQKGKNAGKIVKAMGRLSKEQKYLLARLSKIKYRAVCCYGADTAIKEIKEYFKI